MTIEKSKATTGRKQWTQPKLVRMDAADAETNANPTPFNENALNGGFRNMS